ncbi:MAG: hypothetical protein CM1200mP14_20710 [Gammaproteobacteria bacterium]|nr:MAG: hypothetical protein CM1200mP14_20710 [Gammaproteobacteria bacterium]
MVANTATGDVRTVIEERLNTYMETRSIERLDNGDFFGGRSGMVGRTSTGMVRMVR